MTARVARSKDEVVAFEAERDEQLLPHERVESIWALVCEIDRIRGGDGTELRFDRSVARLERRRR
jgi:hypothetical protein